MKYYIAWANLMKNIFTALYSFLHLKIIKSIRKQLLHFGAPFDNFGGFKSYRLLRPLEGNTYKLYFGFANRSAYEDFKSSDLFQDHFLKQH